MSVLSFHAKYLQNSQNNLNAFKSYEAFSFNEQMARFVCRTKNKTVTLESQLNERN